MSELGIVASSDTHDTPSKQEILDRIAAQRVRLRERHDRRAQVVAMSREANRVAGLGPDAPLAQRVAVFVRLHPIACAVAAAVAVVIGPKKLIRLTGVALPLVMKMWRR